MVKTIFWNVDTQYDFMRNDDSFKGALPVPNAREIEGNLVGLTDFAAYKRYQVVNTADWHNMDDKEISLEPNFVDTYNPHCMAGTEGAEYVLATRPLHAYTVDWKDADFNKDKLLKNRNVVLYKNKFDIFAGNPHADKVVESIAPERAVVYGVALNVCVDFAVRGLRERGVEVYAVVDAMKDLPHLKGTPLDTETVLANWKTLGAKLVTTKDVLEDRI